MIALVENIICNRRRPNEAVAHSEGHGWEICGRSGESRAGRGSGPVLPDRSLSAGGPGSARRIAFRTAAPEYAYKPATLRRRTNEGNDTGILVFGGKGQDELQRQW